MSAEKAAPADRPEESGQLADAFATGGAPMRVLAVDVSAAAVEIIRLAGAEVIDVPFTSLNLALLAQWTPDAVVAPLMGADFDIVDLGQRLEKLAFGGHLYALADPMPNSTAIIRELRDHCPGLAFDIISFPAR